MYEQIKDKQDQPQVNIEQVKGNFDKQITKFKSLGKILYNLGKYKQIAQYFDSLAQNAEHYLVSKSDTWFDNITIKRNTKELKTYAKEFAKVAGEAQALQQRMLTLYEDMGVILNRYFDVPDEQMEAMGMDESPVGIEEEAYYRKHKQAEVTNTEDDLNEAREPLNTHAGSKYYELRTKQGMSHEEAAAAVNQAKKGKMQQAPKPSVKKEY